MLNDTDKLTRLLASGILFMAALAALIIFVVDELTGRPISTEVQGLLTFVIGIASTVTGYHIGLASQPTKGNP